jgi:hypothetical protein
MPYSKLKFNNFDEVERLLDANRSKVKCGSCEEDSHGKLLTLRGYPEYEHEGGIQIADKKYWLYLHCSWCGHDTALWKLGFEGLR